MGDNKNDEDRREEIVKMKKKNILKLKKVVKGKEEEGLKWQK